MGDFETGAAKSHEVPTRHLLWKKQVIIQVN